MAYGNFQALRIEVTSGVATVTVPHLAADETTRGTVHGEFGRVWRRLEADDAVRAVLVTGTDDEFYASGTPTSPMRTLLATADPERIWPTVMRLEREVNEVVYELVHFGKPVVSAINGKASGAGLAIALLADISIAAEDAQFRDPHMLMGMAAGDGAALIWPLLVSMAKAKLYLLTADALDGREAERIGLVSLVTPAAELLATAQDYARRLAEGPAAALRFTKRSLNQWLRLGALVSYDQSFALMALSMFGPEARDQRWPEEEKGE
jgi:enoyl-CoA hydratase